MTTVQTKIPLDSITIIDGIFKPIKVTIDGKHIEVDPRDRNIVDVATRSKIGIPAPCYRDEGRVGCCKGCVAEIDGEQIFACATKPQEGMDIVINRPDLKAIRKERIKDYMNNIDNGETCDCSSDDSSCCAPSQNGTSCCG
ncbi:MAG: (2Fe-2S)-binding protein [Candidatus Marinimicrobia bacterium]|nr:(2Fe-2S)-binding protein [Candidatus Neomarinimicrobiota bacterium]MCF7921282.1 (2Fe-2S)-binding protein [Candidatus Neomarinimicrobiota bacterium]